MTTHPNAGPDPPGFEPAPPNEGSSTGSSRTPSRLARRTWTVWQFQPIPALSGLLPTLPGTSRVRLPSASPDRCDGPEMKVLHLHSEQQAPHGAPRAGWWIDQRDAEGSDLPELLDAATSEDTGTENPFR